MSSVAPEMGSDERRRSSLGESQEGGTEALTPVRARCFVVAVLEPPVLSRGEGPAAPAEGAVELAAALLTHGGHVVNGREVLPAAIEVIRRVVLEAVESGTADLVLITGGCGIAHRDSTPEAVTPLFTCALDGFGELLRRELLAIEGPRALLHRPVAGIVGRTMIAALPSSPHALRLGIERVLEPLLPEAIYALHAVEHTPPMPTAAAVAGPLAGVPASRSGVDADAVDADAVGAP